MDSKWDLLSDIFLFDHFKVFLLYGSFIKYLLAFSVIKRV